MEDNFDALNCYLYSSLLVKCGMFEKSLEFILKSLNLFPSNQSGWNLLLFILVRLDESKIYNSLNSLPDHLFTKIFKIQLLSELQQTESSIRLFNELNLPKFPSIIALEATLHYHHRNFDKSADLFSQLRKIDPYRIESLELYSNLLYVKDDLLTLAELSNSLSSIDKFRPETLSVLGNFYSLNKKHEEAIEQFIMALRFNSQFNFAWTLIGHEFVELDNIPAAIAAYTKAYEINPRDFRALYGLGRAYEISRMPYQAVMFYKNAVALNPFDSRLWMALGECYEELGESPSSIRCYQRAVCNSDNDGIALFKLGKLYKDAGENDRAAFCFENYVENYFGKNALTIEKKEEEYDSILFLSQYFNNKKNHSKAENYAQMLLVDPRYVAEAGSILKDLRNKN